ncbi:MAG TPA: hypothetical protein VMZ28_06785 [Kofleriaceae bacterium]|nr:hypothetical protein [Kofleriaceae bacterium]
MPRCFFALLLGAMGCGASTPAGPAGRPAAASGAPEAGAPAEKKGKEDPLFPDRPSADLGKLDPATRARVLALGDDTRAFLDRGKTPRRAVAALVDLDRGTGAAPLADGARLAAGARAYWVAPGGDAAVLLLGGKGPAVRAVVAVVDAPRIDLKQVPIYQHGGGAWFDTALYGELSLEHWLTRPLALYLRVDRGARSAPVDLAIGDRPGDPVLAIPDVPIHLARHIQHDAKVDTAERLDAFAGASARSLEAALRKHGVRPRDLAEAEAYLVPAGPAVAVGVDRALIGGYGAAHRAVAYAAVRALAAARPGESTRAVVLISKSQVGGSGSTGLAFVGRALSRAIRAAAGDDIDGLVWRRALARSSLVYATGVDADLSHGLLISPIGDDALPGALRPLLDRLTAAGAPVTTTDKAFYDVRQLAELNLDAVGLGIAARGIGAPMELISAVALHHAQRGLEAWLAD